MWLLFVVVPLAVGCDEGRVQGSMKLHGVVDQSLPTVDGPIRIGPDDLPPGRDHLTFAATPYLPESVMREAFAPIARYIGEQLGVEVKFRLAHSYKELIELTESGQVDIAQISPLSYVIARRDVPGLKLVGSSLSFGVGFYSSFIIGRSDMAPEWTNKILGKKFAFVDTRSGSGFLFPYAALLDLGIDPEKDVQVVFSKSHDKSVQMVLNGDVAAAAISSGTLNSARHGEVIGAGDLRILHKAGRIPYDALCVSAKVPDSGAEKISAAFATLNTKSARGREALRKARGLTGWVKADDSQYDEVRAKLEQVEKVRWRSWKIGKQAQTEEAHETKRPVFAAPAPTESTGATR